ncbi:hypothetical protein [Streptomyces sp. NPDC088358]|uniref:hypothetical protein n=1 Tax=Streptomyces sp. NPDC088358 TaxID=3365857 RepID=UPI00381F73A0
MACEGDSKAAWTGETLGAPGAPGAVLSLLKDGNSVLQQRIEVVRQNVITAPHTDDEPAVADDQRLPKAPGAAIAAA